MRISLISHTHITIAYRIWTYIFVFLQPSGKQLQQAQLFDTRPNTNMQPSKSIYKVAEIRIHTPLTPDVIQKSRATPINVNEMKSATLLSFSLTLFFFLCGQHGKWMNEWMSDWVTDRRTADQTLSHFSIYKFRISPKSYLIVNIKTLFNLSTINVKQISIFTPAWSLN